MLEGGFSRFSKKMYHQEGGIYRAFYKGDILTKTSLKICEEKQKEELV